VTSYPYPFQLVRTTADAPSYIHLHGGDIVASCLRALPPALPSSLRQPATQISLYLRQAPHHQYTTAIMSVASITHCSSAPPDIKSTQASSSSPSSRPQFNTHLTSDRLREGSGLLRNHQPFSMVSNIRKGRKSIFKELGLDDDFSDDGYGSATASPTSPVHGGQGHEHSLSANGEKDFHEIKGTRSSDTPNIAEHRIQHDQYEGDDNISSSKQGPKENSENCNNPDAANLRRQPSTSKRWFSKLATVGYRRPRVKTASSAPSPTVFSSPQRLAMIALLIAVVLPAFSYHNGRETVGGNGADAAAVIRPRQTSPVQVCTRWSHQGRFLLASRALIRFFGRSNDANSPVS
jgi:hypothetical protein